MHEINGGVNNTNRKDTRRTPFHVQRDPKTLANVLMCVLDMDESTAKSAALSQLVWNESRFAVSWTTNDTQLSDRVTLTWRLNAAHATTQHAWEALAASELIPEHWVGTTDRTFMAIQPGRGPIGPNVGPCVLSYPPTVRSCITVASDIAAMISAETLAKELASRLWRWNKSNYNKTNARWLFADQRWAGWEQWQRSELLSEGMSGPQRVLRYTATLAGVGLADRYEQIFLSRTTYSLTQEAEAATQASALWDEIAKLGVKIPNDPNIPSQLVHQTLDQVANPYSVLSAMYETGYVIDGFVGETVRIRAAEI